MNTNIKSWGYYCIIGFLFLAIFYFLLSPHVYGWILNKKSKYSITTGKYDSYPRTSTRYYFIVNGSTYAGDTKKLGIEKGHFYFVRFYPKYPDLINEILDIEADSNDIKSMPSGGYDKLPDR